MPFTRILCLVLEIKLRVGVFAVLDFCLFCQGMSTLLVVQVGAVFRWVSKVIAWLQLLHLVIGLKVSHQFFSQFGAKLKLLALCAIFLTLWASYKYVLGILIGSSPCSLLLWLVGVIILVLVFLQSLENCSNDIEDYDVSSKKKIMIIIIRLIFGERGKFVCQQKILRKSTHMIWCWLQKESAVTIALIQLPWIQFASLEKLLDWSSP